MIQYWKISEKIRIYLYLLALWDHKLIAINTYAVFQNFFSKMPKYQIVYILDQHGIYINKTKIHRLHTRHWIHIWYLLLPKSTRCTALNTIYAILMLTSLYRFLTAFQCFLQQTESLQIYFQCFLHYSKLAIFFQCPLQYNKFECIHF